MDAGVDDLGLALRPDHEDRWHLALDDATRKVDVNAPTVVIDGDGLPGRVAAAQAVAVVAGSDGWNDRRCRNGLPCPPRGCGYAHATEGM